MLIRLSDTGNQKPFAVYFTVLNFFGDQSLPILSNFVNTIKLTLL